MHVAHLSLVDFRSYPTLELPLEPGVSALIGPNGQGKTNLVEAIGYLSTGTSHRVATDAALVRMGAPRAVVRAKVARGDRATLLELEINPGKANRARVNRAPVPRSRDAIGILRTVLFAPEDLDLVKGDPGGRRRFLDELVVLLTPRMAGVLADYDRVLRQRSALLKSAGGLRSRGRGAGPTDDAQVTSGSLRTLDVWDGKLAAAGAQIMAARLRLVRALRPWVARCYEQVSSGQGDAVISYRSSLEAAAPTDRTAEAAPEDVLPSADLLEAQLLEAMSRLRSKEIERGVCLVGPHRDDLHLQLGGMPAKGYASHGESWSFALALRLASYRLLTDAPVDDGGPVDQDLTGSWGADGEPVLILDDVFAELDVRRRDRLAGLVGDAGQVIVTAAVPDDVPERLDGARIDVMDGEVTRVR